MRYTARWIALGVGIVVISLAVVLALNVGTDPLAATKQSQLMGKAAPKIDLVDLEGNPVTSDALAGKTVIVNFWNEWCIPCIQEVPALKTFWQSHENDGDVAMVGVVHASDASKQKLSQYAARAGLDWTLAEDPGKRAALDFAIRGQPETFAIAPNGQITGYQYGPATARGLEAMLQNGADLPVTKRVWPWVALGALVVVVLAVVLWPNGEPTVSERAHSIAAGLKCQECQGLSVADSNAETSRAIRADIKRRVAAGQSNDEIRRHYVDQYGEQILLDPQSSGISLLVWVLPVVVIAAGATGVVFAIARNRREPRLHATAADEALVERERTRA